MWNTFNAGGKEHKEHKVIALLVTENESVSMRSLGCSVLIAYNGKPGKHHVDQVVERLDGQEHLAHGTMTRRENELDVPQGVERGEERAVQPAPTLQNDYRR